MTAHKKAPKQNLWTHFICSLQLLW